MATVEMSSDFHLGYMVGNSYISGFCHRMMQTNEINNFSAAYHGYFGGWVNSSAASTAFIRIMKGTIPTDFSGLTVASSRSTDVLLQVLASDTTYYNITSNINPIVINTNLKAAIASGIATWFWVGCYYNSNNIILNQFLGNVGVTGSGADLEIADTNIISGNQYKVVNLRIDFPRIWTY